jgi:hypothetical protein
MVDSTATAGDLCADLTGGGPDAGIRERLGLRMPNGYRAGPPLDRVTGLRRIDEAGGQVSFRSGRPPRAMIATRMLEHGAEYALIVKADHLASLDAEPPKAESSLDSPAVAFPHQEVRLSASGGAGGEQHEAQQEEQHAVQQEQDVATQQEAQDDSPQGGLQCTVM